MNFLINSIILFVVFLIVNIQCKLKCSTSRTPRFHLIERCHRSKLGIAARAKYASLISCKRLAIEKKALAFNFSPNWNTSSTNEYPCEVLKCAEAEGGLSLNNDTRYDYYSIYANPLPNVNTTCVPATGMFYLSTQKKDYTSAEDECKNMSSVLADITSKQRTDALAQVLTGAGVNAAFVGLKRENTSTFYGVDGHGLDCITYRAWAPSHPRQDSRHNCVVLTKHHTWKSTPCSNTYPALCEMIASGPYRAGSIFKDQFVKPSSFKGENQH